MCFKSKTWAVWSRDNCVVLVHSEFFLCVYFFIQNLERKANLPAVLVPKPFFNFNELLQREKYILHTSVEEAAAAKNELLF